MPSSLTCVQGHQWQPADAAAAPLVCPTCGRAPVGPVAVVDDERTLDISPVPVTPVQTGAFLPAVAAPPPRDEVTQTLHFTPPPHPPVAQAASNTQASVAGGRSLGGTAASGAGAMFAKPAAGMPFVIVRQHAKGGLGVVSLARDDQIKREVALKQILPQHVDNPVLQRRFLYEARITGQLEHPSIVPVYTLGSDDAGQPFYVMRFVKGRTLDEIIKEHHAAPNAIVFRELLRRFIAVCQAVAYAHSRGVIHRDLKPANIMLGDYGETLVLDWGLAKDIKHPNNDPALWGANTPAVKAGAGTAGAGAAGAAPRVGSVTPANSGSMGSELTMEGQLIGTPAYMAPEQAEGKTELHAPTTDIYALGGILYKIMTGQSPSAPTSSTAAGAPGQRRLVFVASPPASRANKDVPPMLEAICTRAMATDPAGRYPRALELAQDIQRWLDEHPLAVPARTSTARLVERLRGHAEWIVLMLVAVVMILLGLLLVRH